MAGLSRQDNVRGAAKEPPPLLHPHRTREPPLTAEVGVDDASARVIPLADLSPEELAARWVLVLPHRERLRKIAARRLSCREEAEDVVQEAMLRAVTFERLDAAYVGQFLSTVTVRLCADVQRDRARQLRVGVRDALRTVPAGDPHDALLDRAEARWLYDECLKLPSRESAVMLARARGLSVRETASTLGVGTKSAEAAFTKARHRMRRAAQSASIAVAGVLRRVRGAGPQAAVAASVTAVTVGGVVGVLVHPGGTPARPPAPPMQVAAPQRPVAAAAPRVAKPAAPPVPPVVTTVVKEAHRVAAPPPKPYVETPPIGHPDHVATQGGVKVREHREDETFEETVERCIGEILTVDPEHPLCDPE